MQRYQLAPSILAADFTHLGEDVRQALQAGVSMIHVDVMDGHFVPNISIGPMIVRALRPLADEYQATLDVHLMISDPDRYLEAFATAGADILTVHVETCPHLHRTVQRIRELGVRPGVTLNPATPLVAGRDVAGSGSGVGDVGESRFRRPVLHRGQHRADTPPAPTPG